MQKYNIEQLNQVVPEPTMRKLLHLINGEVEIGAGDKKKILPISTPAGLRVAYMSVIIGAKSLPDDVRTAVGNLAAEVYKQHLVNFEA
jgi:hypothetical protein